ncbi:hypothetical protein ACFL3F_05290 [Planctomycetota bacterium]
MNGQFPLTLRLRFWLLWIRYSYPFRWAHRPLCTCFRAGVLRLGSMHLCRSCVCVYAGMVLTVAGCLVFSDLRANAAALLVGFMVPTIALSLPQMYHRCSRSVRDVLRVSMGACIPLCASTAFIGHPWMAALCASLLYVFWRIYFKMRQRRRALACNDCPEYKQSGICTGCQIQAEAVRAYEAEATQLLLNHRGVYPAVLKK